MPEPAVDRLTALDAALARSKARETATKAQLDRTAEKLAGYRGSHAAAIEVLQGTLTRLAADRRTSHIPPPGARSVTIHGVHFSVPDDTTEPGSLSDRVLHGWLPLNDLLATRAFVVGGIMLDIGANIGTTCLPRAVLGDFTRIYAAEPDPENFACLAANIRDNGLDAILTADRLAVANWTGPATLKRAARIGSHTLRLSGASSPTSIDVACTTVDAWLAGHGVDPAGVRFVKTDTQGFDALVLAGARSVLEQRRAVWQIEVSPGLLARSGTSLPALVAFVSDHFSHCWDLDAGGEARPATDLAALVEAGSRRYANVLLYNA